MATTSVRRLKNAPSPVLQELEKDIIENADQYDFFQTYRLLESVNDAYPVSPRRPKRQIHVRPNLSLAYKNKDVHSVNLLDKQSGYEIVTQIAGLYGVSSPLPDFYNEELLDNEWDDAQAPREFLDIIHRQLFPKLYSAWKFYKVNLNTVEKNNNGYWSLLYNLLGLPDSNQDLDTESEIDAKIKQLKIRYFNLFSNKERSASGLQLILSDYLDEDDIQITEFKPEEIALKPQLRWQLGTLNSHLGEAHLGSKIQTQVHKITINVKGVDEDKYRAIYSDDEWIHTLKVLISHYLTNPIKVDLVMDVIPSDSRTQLGKNWHELGKSTVLGRSSSLFQSITMNLIG